MTGTQNPFQSPVSADPPKSWWRKLAQQVTPNVLSSQRRFEDGQPEFFYGVVFFIDPAEPRFLHAALPSSEASDARMKRNVAEVVRVLPDFVQANPELHSLIRGRRVVVRMIELYAELDVEKYARVELGSDVLENAFLNVALSTEPQTKAKPNVGPETSKDSGGDGC